MKSVNLLYKIIAIAFALFWVLFIMLDYWQKHPLIWLSFENFRYTGLSVFYLLTTILFTIGVYIGFFRKQKKWLTWIIPYLTMILFMYVSMYAYQGQISKFIEFDTFTLNNLGFFLFKVLRLSLSLLFIVMVCRSLGRWIFGLFKINGQSIATSLIQIAIGIATLVTILFYLGIFGLLRDFILWPVCLLILGLDYKANLQFLKNLLLKPIVVSEDFNWLGALSFSLLIIIISINFTQIIRPIPTGFDALTLYMNLPSLINDYSGLVQGYQPYNWSLFMSLGFIMFYSTEYALALSALGGLLSLLVMFWIGRNWLKLNINLVLLSLSVFYLMPTIIHQSSKELKVDLGLLFMLLCIVMLFLVWKSPEHENEENKLDKADALLPKWIEKASNNSLIEKLRQIAPPYLILLGLLTGFALGIKLTALFIFFSVVAAMWFLHAGKYGFLGIFCLSVFAVLLFKLDNLGDLRQYHIGAWWQQWVMLAAGIALIVYILLKDREKSVKEIKHGLIYLLFTIIPFFPWLVKNYSETKKTDINAILNGKPTGPNVSIQKMNQKYQNYKNSKK